MIEINNFSTIELSVLLKEPNRLESSIAALQSQFEESMTRNYDFFIKTCESASTITDDLENSTYNIGLLSTNLSKSNDLCSELSLLAQNTLLKSTRFSSAFRHLPQISDILNIPQLMNTCRISSLYEEAFQLYQIIERFSHQYPTIKVLQNTLNESNKVKNEVTKSLLDSFTKDLDLKDAIRTVNLLRTSNLHTEYELRLAFLNGKRQKLYHNINNLPKSGPVFFIDKITENYRTILYEASTQYKALFSGDDSDDDMTLHLTLHFEIDQYCNYLKENLNLVNDISDAKNIIQTALFFGSSFGRLGFNFCSLIENIFYNSKWYKN